MILVTGCAGFIGFHVARRFLADGHQVHGLDNLNDYYDPQLKKDRLEILHENPSFTFHRCDIARSEEVRAIFNNNPIKRVIHLAAQAGVRYSLTHPAIYAESNITGFLNVLENCRHHSIEHLVYASSSSVYGLNSTMPFSVHHNVDHPVSLYAATKKANELMAHSYSHLFRLPTTGLRFFTVYGPWGRPDMAFWLFADAITKGRPIDLFNDGKMQRDFTFIDDVVEAIVRVLERPAKPDPAWSPQAPEGSASSAPYRIYNIGNHTPVALGELVDQLERALGRPAVRCLRPMQPGDVAATCADMKDLTRDFGFAPSTPLAQGVASFATWFLEYHRR